MCGNFGGLRGERGRRGSGKNGFGRRELEQSRIFTKSVSKVRSKGAKYRRVRAGCGSEVMAWVRGGRAGGEMRASSERKRLHSVSVCVCV